MIVSELGRVAPSQHKVNDDFEFARQNLMDIIINANQSISELAQLAAQAQNDKYYVALANLYRTAADANEKLLDLQEKISRLNKLEGNKPATQITHNNLIMTTEELRRLIMNDSTSSST